MDFNVLINKRYSARAYRPDPVEDEKLDKVLNSARMAPTAANRQPFQVIVIHTKGKEIDLLDIYPRKWFAEAPILLCVCGINDIAWTRNDNKKFTDVDAAIVMDHMILAATELGLGTCYVAAFNIENARKTLCIPDEIEPILFTPLGYANDSPKEKERKSLNDLVRYERW
jgi:nitroreductase